MNLFKEMLAEAEADVKALEALALRAEAAVARIFAAKASLTAEANTTVTPSVASDPSDGTPDADASDEVDHQDGTALQPAATTVGDNEVDDIAIPTPPAGTAAVAVAENPPTAAAS